MELLTKQDCKKMLSSIGFKLGVSPRLISERLLSDRDKLDMMQGLISFASLEASVELWRDNCMPDYVYENKAIYEENA